MTRTIKRTESQELLCQLTGDALVARGSQLGGVIQEIAALEQQRKALNEEYSAQIKLAKTRRDRLAEAVTTGRELQAVTCEVWADIAQGVYLTIRSDTGEVVSERVMTTSELDHERQIGLPLDDDPITPDDISLTFTLLDADTPKEGEPDPEKEEEPTGEAPDMDLVADVDNWTRGECNEWLRVNDKPVPAGKRAHERAIALIKAIMLDDYDAPAAEAAFGPLKWPGDSAPELNRRRRESPQLDQDAPKEALVLDLGAPVTCMECEQPMEECACPLP